MVLPLDVNVEDGVPCLPRMRLLCYIESVGDKRGKVM